MKLRLQAAAAALALAFVAPVIAHAALAEQGPQETVEAASENAGEPTAEQGAAPAEGAVPVMEVPAITAPQQPAPAEAAEAEEEKLICRSIRLDMSSRRKTRVCRTEEGWKALNQQR